MTAITLEPAELAFLLTLVDAQTIPGLAVAHLFPEDKAARQALLDQGAAALTQHGHLQLAGGHFEGLATPLLLAVAVLAAPAQVIVTTHYLEGGNQLLLHAIAGDLVVELYPTGAGDFRLAALASMESVVTRLLLRLDLDGPAAASNTVPLAPALLAQLRHGAPVAERAALPDRALDNGHGGRLPLGEPLGDFRILADISLEQVASGARRPQLRLTVLASAGGTGLVHFVQPGEAALTMPAGPALRHALHDWRLP